MNYGYIKVKCPRCGSVIDIMSGNPPAEIFHCPVCTEGEIHRKSNRPAGQPVSVSRKNNQRLWKYVTTPGNICIN